MFEAYVVARFKSLFACFVLLTSIWASPAAFGASDRRAECRAADADAQIMRCTQLIERRSRVTKGALIAAYLSRGTAYQTKGQLDRALVDFDKALQLDPRSTPARRMRALTYHALGEFDRAIADYAIVIAAQPKSAVIFYERGEFYRAKNDLDRAIADYSEALQLKTASHRLMAVEPGPMLAKAISTRPSPISKKR